MKRAAALLPLLLLSCEPVVHRIVTLAFNDTADMVTISAATRLGEAKQGTPESKQIEEEREALLAGRDEWSLRFANANPEEDNVSLTRRRGLLQAVERSASIPPENLQKFFFDTALTVTFIRGEGWAELSIYPGSSARATRQQQMRVEKTLALYSQAAQRYFSTLRVMYAYLDAKPFRARALFTAVFRDEKDEEPVLSEKEKDLISAVRAALDALTSSEEGSAAALDRDFDLVYNPFPADIRIKVRGEVLINENFTKSDDLLVIKTTSALEAVAALQGRWISPDPLAVVMAAPGNEKAADLAATIADMPRRATPVVTAGDIADALIEKMRPAARYRLRWMVKAKKN